MQFFAILVIKVIKDFVASVIYYNILYIIVCPAEWREHVRLAGNRQCEGFACSQHLDVNNKMPMN